MKDAVIVVDMVKDNVNTSLHTGISGEARKIIPNLQSLLATARQKGFLVVYANDSFYPTDVIFRGRVKPHALRGTAGVQVITELKPEPGDIILEKRRMSAFFKTDLDITLRDNGVERVAVAGIATPFCVLLTALDALCYGFKTVILEDCCTAYPPEDHLACLNIYRKDLFGEYFQILKMQKYFDLT
ncbi:MAG: cysteine hydrolase [Armatimonadetes bacterium]|nr:cysteine hydrolase [Armatimonadota bacterium]